MEDELPRVSRRDALRTIGASGALSALATTRTAATSTAPAGSAVESPSRTHGWTDKQSHEIQRPSCIVNSTYTSHTLSYLDVTWERYGAPNVDRGSEVQGCWRHTFAMTGVGATGYDDEFAPGLPYGAVSVNAPTIGTDEDHPAEQQTDAAVEPTATAVSARRGPSQYSFVERTAFEQYLRPEGVAPSDLATTGLSGSDIHDGLFATQAALEGASNVDYSMALSATSSLLGSIPSSDDGALGRFQRYASNGSIALDVLSALGAYADALTVPEPPRVDRGFSATFPASIYEDSDEIVSERRPGVAPDKNYGNDKCNTGGTYFDAGCHYLLFDVLEVPGTGYSSAVDVVSAFDRTSDGTTGGPSTGWSIVFDTPVPDGGDPSTVSEAERFSATRTVSPHVTRRDPSQEVTN